MRFVQSSVFAALLVALACTLAAPARADLLLPQPARENPNRALWGSIYDRIPLRLRPTRDVIVREVSDREMDRLVREDPEEAARKDGSTVNGMFFFDDRDEPTILLRRSLTGEKAAQVFTHELGHLVWDTHLSAAQQREYTAAYRRARAGKRLVTEYAGESVCEGFAEAFAFFVLKPETLQARDPLSFAVLQRLSAGR